MPRRYAALTTVKEKKAAFSEWRGQRDREAKERAREAKEAGRRAFVEMLEEGAERIRGARNLVDVAGALASDPRWKGVGGDRERDELFREWGRERERREAEERRERLAARVAGFRGALERAGVRATDRWRDVEGRVEGEPESEGLTRAERLDAFAAHVDALADEERAAAREARAAGRRAARRARDLFRALLESLRAQGRVHVRMRWAEVLPIIDGEEAYEQCKRCGPGSTPRELFEDAVCALEEELEAQRGTVRAVMREFGVDVGPGTTFEAFRARLGEAAAADAEQRRGAREGAAPAWPGDRSVEEEVAAVPTLHLRILFDEAVDQALQGERRAERRRRRARDDFMALLRHKGRLTAESTYEGAREALAGRRDWEAIETEEERRELFGRVLRRVAERAEAGGGAGGRSRSPSPSGERGDKRRASRSRSAERPGKRARRAESEDSKEDGEL